MPKFFQRIRRKLLDERSLRKYLTYAIGEVFLVMIGILLALQVNNWNENRKTRNKEQQYLLALREEFNGNPETLEKEINKNCKNLDAGKIITESMAGSRLALEEAKFSQLFNRAFYSEVSFTPNTGVLTEMINSGNLKDLKNI